MAEANFLPMSLMSWLAGAASPVRSRILDFGHEAVEAMLPMLNV
jgi:hypothetical protein